MREDESRQLSELGATKSMVDATRVRHRARIDESWLERDHAAGLRPRRRPLNRFGCFDEI
jgi:hypothetical protein